MRQENPYVGFAFATLHYLTEIIFKQNILNSITHAHSGWWLHGWLVGWLVYQSLLLMKLIKLAINNKDCFMRLNCIHIFSSLTFCLNIKMLKKKSKNLCNYYPNRWTLNKKINLPQTPNRILLHMRTYRDINVLNRTKCE